MSYGTLRVVSTPIGNLEDITLRALRVLKEADIIAAEDTRHTGILLKRYGIHNRLTSFFSHSSLRKKDDIVKFLKEGKNIALVSDAGTPGISDPGFSLIRAAIDENIRVEAIPGPTALITALVVSGKPTASFVFEGFLSNKKAKRRKQLARLKEEKRTVIFYESCHRIAGFLRDILDVMGDREIVVTRELTKKFEEIKREKTSTLLEHFTNVKPRGEFIVVM